MADNTTIKCNDCGHDNEAERVYCHNCGSKLDRSLLPKPEEKKHFETPEQTRRRVGNMMNPKGNWVKRDVKALFKTLIFAALVAALVLVFWPPERPDLGKIEPDYTLRSQWEDQMLTKAQSTVVEYKQEDMNRFLKTLKGGEGAIPGVKFKSACVRINDQAITLFVERDAWGFATLWSSVDYKPVVKDGKLLFEVKGVHFGRLGVHPSATFAHGWGAEAVLKSLQKDFGKTERVQSIQLRNGVVTLTTR